MRISIASEKKQLETYLSAYESINLVNFYSNLQTEYDRFSNDLNKVDIFAIIEYADISSNLTALSKLVLSGDGYLLGAKEILIILNGNSQRTQNRDDKVNALKDILEEKNFDVRIVTPNILDFTSIYNAFIKNTTVQESKIKIYTKYKVYEGDNGIVLKPKKSKNKFAPDIKTGNRQSLKKIDNDTAELLKNETLEISDREDFVERVNDNIVGLPDLVNLTNKVIFITGVTNVGKTHTMITLAEELNKNKISTLIVDSTGSDDIKYIAEAGNFKITIIRGSEIFNIKEQHSTGIYLYNKAYSSTFLHELLPVSKNKNITFCEVDIDNLENFISTWDGDVQIILVIKLDITGIKEIKDKIIPNKPYIVYVNNDKDEITEEEKTLIKQLLGESIKIFNYKSRLDLFNSLGGL
ncbi:MAG: hypothetical protein FWF57_00605 [Defluviitaleaceae bacterium]|nr:hypothetical protein [Defluviitaleaceae bacterium]